MAGHGKTITLFMMDGDLKGRVKCSMSNWKGLVFRIPRQSLKDCKTIKELKHSGVYALIRSPSETSSGFIYIGQAGLRKNQEGPLLRLTEHDRQKEFWNEALIVTTTDNSFGPTEISYLESRFCAIATESELYTVKNSNEPSQGHVTEEKKSELEDFIDSALTIINDILGSRISGLVQPTKKINLSTKNKERRSNNYFIKSHDADAIGYPLSDDKFCVTANSLIRPLPTPSCPLWIRNLRKAYNDLIVNNKLTKDLVFNSPSAASGFVLFTSSNGKTAWKTADGKSLKNRIDSPRNQKK